MAFRRLHQAFKHLMTTPAKHSRISRRRHRGRLAGRASAQPYAMEWLEDRFMLTTVTGGDTFEFRQSGFSTNENSIIRVKLEGNITAELVGAQVDRTNNDIKLGNVPGRLNGTDVLGGLTGGQGASVIGQLDQPIPGLLNPNILALAANGENQFYALHSGPNGVAVVRLTLPAADVAGATAGPVAATVVIPATSNGALRNARAADFNPVNGLLYFTATDLTTGDVGLFTLNLSTDDPNTPAFEGDPVAVRVGDQNLAIAPATGQGGVTTLDTIAFNSTGGLFGVVNTSTINPDGSIGQTSSQLIRISAGLGTILSSVAITTGGGAAGGGGGNQTGGPITGIDFDNQNRLLGVTAPGNANGLVLQIFTNTGTALILGGVEEQNSAGLSFVTFAGGSGRRDPFSGSGVGGFIGFDNANKEFFFLNAIDRFPAQYLWNVYITHSDETGKIVIGWVRDLTPTAQDVTENLDTTPISPFVGSTFSIRAINAQNGTEIPTLSPTVNVGNALIGAVSQKLPDAPAGSKEDRIPYLTQPVPTDVVFQTLPPSVSELAPGVIVSPGNDVGKFMLAGTLTGQVNAGGSLDFFYAGWVITGVTAGQSESSPEVDDNFKVAGDLRSLITRETLGSSGDGGDAPAYLSGFDLQVNGQVGTVRSYGSAYLHAEINHFDNAPRLQTDQLESEFHSRSKTNGFENFNFGPSDGLKITINPDQTANGGPDSFMFNDTYDTAEYLGSISSDALGRSGVIRLDGTLQKTLNADEDEADYYAVALMAGQTYTVRVRETETFFDTNGNVISGDEVDQPSSAIRLGVFDPDGRLIASDYNNTNPDETASQYFSFKADRPGIYRFAVASVGDAPAFGHNVGLFTITTYRLTALGIGDMAIGGLVAQGTILDLVSATTDTGFEIFRGDVGAIRSNAGSFRSNSFRTLNVEVGNIRALDAAVNLGGLAADDIILEAPEGSVGLLRAGGAFLVINRLVPIDGIRAIGGDFQLVDGPNATVDVVLKANRGIGVIRAGNMATNSISVLDVNADNTGEDGIIDLIDVNQDMGTLGAGGPSITTHTGGNVRFIRVGGTVYQDRFFGGGGPQNIIIDPGQTDTIIDDSGAHISLTPIGETLANPAFDPAFPQAGVTERIGPGMLVTTYPIRGSGGSVIVDVTSSGGLDVKSTGATAAELSRVEIRGVGEEVQEGAAIVDASTPSGRRNSFTLDPGITPTATPTPTPTPVTQPRVFPQDLTLNVHGSSLVDILDVVVIDTGTDTDSGDGTNGNILDADGAIAFGGGGDFTRLGNAVSITNDTGGDILNVLAESIGLLYSKGNVGMMRNTTGADVIGLRPDIAGNDLPSPRTLREIRPTPTVDVSTVQPYNGIREGIMVIGGNVGEIRAGKAIGNVFVQGSIDKIRPNSDGVDDPATFEGIDGVIRCNSFTALEGISNNAGRIFDVDIGEGILPSGSGNFSRAGLFVFGTIALVHGENADIRGDIYANNSVATGDTNPNDNIVRSAAIETIRLNNGSIINSDILVTSDAGDAREFVGGYVIPNTPDSLTSPIAEIARVVVSGNGGILGSNFVGPDIGTISVRGSAGFLNNAVLGLADATVENIETNGYGIRNVFINAAQVNNLIANGDGTSLSTNAIEPNLRFSEQPSDDPILGAMDPYFGFQPNGLTDIHANLEGSDAIHPEVSGVTDTGIIEATEATGRRDLRNVKAWQIRKQSRFDFGNAVGTLQVGDIINGLELTTGTLKNFTLNQDAFALTVTVSGRVKKVNIKGSLAENSVIRTQGTGGQIDSLTVKGNLVGDINSSRSIKSINIGGDFTGNITVNGTVTGDRTGTAIKTIKVGGAFLASSINITGDVGSIISAGSLGSLGDTLTVTGNVGKLQVGGDLRSNVRVTGNVKSINVKGSIVDGGIEDGLVIDVSQTITSLAVGGDIQQGVQVNAKAIKKTKIGGQNLGEFNIVQ